MKEIQDAEKVSSHLMYEYEEIQTVFYSSNVASWIVRYSTEVLGLPKFSPLTQASSRPVSPVNAKRRSSVCSTW
jgi:hypothetical protein